MARRDVFDDAAFDDFVGALPLGPVRDGASRLLGGLTGHGHDGADLLGGDPWPATGARGIAEALLDAHFRDRDRLEEGPALPPEADCIESDLEGLGDGGVALTIGRPQDDAGAQDQLLRGQVSLEENLQRLALLVGQFDRQRLGATHNRLCWAIGCAFSADPAKLIQPGYLRQGALVPCLAKSDVLLLQATYQDSNVHDGCHSIFAKEPFQNNVSKTL
jgi:hypothetical protein